MRQYRLRMNACSPMLGATVATSPVAAVPRTIFAAPRASAVQHSIAMAMSPAVSGPRSMLGMPWSSAAGRPGL